MRYDVVVIGLGAAGSGALWGLARRGALVLGVEQFDLAHSRGSSHGRSRLFRGGASEGAIYVDLAGRALEIWHDMEQRTDRQIITLTSGLTIAPESSELYTATQAALESRDKVYEVLDASALVERFPQHRIRPADVGLLDPASGAVRPELAITTAVELAKQHGAEVRSGVAVKSIDERASGHRIRFADGTTADAARVILSAGAWNDKLLPGIQTPFTVRRAILTWFQPKPGRVDEFTPDRFPVFTRVDEHVQGWGAPIIDEFGVKLGLHDQSGYEIDDPSANRPDALPAEVAGVQQFCERQFDGLVPVATHARGCMITVTPDENFSVGELTSHPGIVLLAACSGHGFKHSPAVGDIGAQLALGEDPGLDLSMFDPDRFTVHETP